MSDNRSDTTPFSTPTPDDTSQILSTSFIVPPPPMRTPPMRRATGPLHPDTDPGSPPPPPLTRQPPIDAHMLRDVTKKSPPPEFDLDANDTMGDKYKPVARPPTPAALVLTSIASLDVIGDTIKGRRNTPRPSAALPASDTGSDEDVGNNNSNNGTSQHPKNMTRQEKREAWLAKKAQKHQEKLANNKPRLAHNAEIKRRSKELKAKIKLEKEAIQKLKADASRDKRAVDAKYKRMALDRKGIKNLATLVDGLLETVISMSSSVHAFNYMKAHVPLILMSENVLMCMKECDQVEMVRTLDDIFNYGLGPYVRNHVPKKIWKIIPRRLPTTSQTAQQQSNANNPLLLYFMALRKLGGQELTSDNDRNRTEAIDLLLSAIKGLTTMHAVNANNVYAPEDMWPEFYYNNGWCLAYHLFWAAMSLMTGDVEECRQMTYVDGACGSVDQEQQFRFRQLEQAEQLFHDYLRFTNYRSAMSTNGAANAGEMEHHHLAHFHMLRMFFQHIWPHAVATYNDYPVVGTSDELKVLTRRHPTPQFYLFCQGHLAQTSVRFPVNMSRLALLFLNNNYQVELAHDLTQAFTHIVREALDTDYMMGLDPPFITQATFDLRQTLPSIEDWTTSDLTDETIDAHDRVWQLVRNEFNDYMISCGMLPDYLQNVNSPRERHRKALASRIAKETANAVATVDTTSNTTSEAVDSTTV